jgi:type IV pilus assembly protein PilB
MRLAMSEAIAAADPPEPATANDLDAVSAVVRLLVDAEAVTAEQVRYARRVRAKLSDRRPMLGVLQHLGFVSAERVREVLSAHRVSIRIGELMVELGLLDNTELEAALALQREETPRRKLGDILLERNFVSEARLLEAISFQLGFPYVDLDTVKPDRELLAQVPRKWCVAHRFIPVRIEDGRALVAFADPLDRDDLEAARRSFPDLIPGIAPRHSIDTALARVSGPVTVQHDEGTFVGIVNSMIQAAISEDISDIHVEPGKDRLRIRFRQDGVLVLYKDFSLDLASGLTNRIKILAGADIAERRRHQDGRVLYEDENGPIDLRVSIYATVHGEKIVLRLLSRRRTLVALDDLGIAPRVLNRYREEALLTPSGVVLVTGPTGSGKTTTLYASIGEINDINTCIVTAEDPVEYLIEGISQCSINPKIQLTFEETLRHIVRQDPDVIVIGEIRDRFSADTAIQAALTGHKVLTTFHTEDSIGGLLRLLNMEIEAFLISSTVVSVVAQRLLRRVCDHCGEDHTPTATELMRLGYTAGDLAGARLRRGRGCAACRFTGYKGRIVVFELLVLNEPVRDAILARRTSFEIRRISMESTGLVTLLEDGIYKAAQGRTTLEEVTRELPRVGKPRPLAQLMRLLGD